MAAFETQVLIIGGGPVGLGCAAELGRLGIATILVEQRAETSPIPRVTTVNTRGMLHCRRWGIVDEVRGAGWPNDYPLDIVFVTSLTGREIKRFVSLSHDEAPLPPEVPENPQTCPQHWFDPLMREFARRTPNTDVRVQWRMESFREDADSVAATVTDLVTDTQHEIRAAYMLGCDGARSPVRQALGIDMAGEDHDFNIHILFRAPGLVERLAPNNARFHYIMGPTGMESILHVIDGHDMWRLALMRFSDWQDETAIDHAAHVRRAIGEEFKYELVGIDQWQRSTRSATAYGMDRIFLVGDAAHTWSPNGGFGMNTGLSDGHDISWKLAATLDGWGGANLLASYDAERRPVCEGTIGEARGNYQRLSGYGDISAVDDDGADGDATRHALAERLERQNRRAHQTLGTELGYSYEASPIIAADGTPKPEARFDTYSPTARPGHLAPHAWFADGRSTMDLFGRGFKLLRLGDAPDASALIDSAGAVPVAVENIANPEIAALYEQPLVLVRPDAHVAWRGDNVPDDPRQLWDKVRGA